MQVKLVWQEYVYEVEKGGEQYRVICTRSTAPESKTEYVKVVKGFTSEEVVDEEATEIIKAVRKFEVLDDAGFYK